jgi:hypothetical protein
VSANRSYELPQKLNSYLSILITIYQRENQSNLLTIIRNASVDITEHWDEDYGGREIGHAVFLHIPDALYAEVLSKKGDLQMALHSDLNKANSVPHEYISAVFLDPLGDSSSSWQNQPNLVYCLRNIW